MPSSFTPSLRLVLPVTGELVGTWGDVTNDGLTELVDAAVAGTAAVTMSDANYTLTVDSGLPDEARKMFVVLTGALTATRNVVCPTASKLYFVFNNTSGGRSILFKTNAGSGVTVPNGQIAVLYCDGTNVVQAINGFPKDLNLPVGTTAERPTGVGGKVFFNTQTAKFEGYNGTSWGQLGGGATGGGTDEVFVENGQNVTTNYTIPTGKNAMSTGPITIDAGATVTIPIDSRWVIL